MTRLLPKTGRNSRGSKLLPWNRQWGPLRGKVKTAVGAGSLLLLSAFVVYHLHPSANQLYLEYDFSSPRNLENVESIYRQFVKESVTPIADPGEAALEASSTSKLNSARETPSNKLPAPHLPHKSKELRPYCENATNFFDVEELELAIGRLRAFHTQGGALKSVQHLLDHNIDATVEKLGAKFVPTGTTEGTHEVTKYLKDYYSKNFDPRGGYGRPLPGVYVSNHDPKAELPLIAGGRYVSAADPDNSKERWDFGLGPFGPKCENLLQLGAKNVDGTKWYCRPKDPSTQSQPEVSPSNLRTPTPPPEATPPSLAVSVYKNCHVISIGGNDNWKFERQVMALMPGCITHTFDCTLPDGQPKRKPRRERVKFYNYCIDSHRHVDEHGRQFITYFDILEKAGLSAAPTLFKIDVEGFEFDIFYHMVQQADTNGAEQSKNTQSFSRLGVGDTRVDAQPAIQPSSYWLPQQIMVELHWATRMTGVSWMPRSRTTAEIALLSNMMYSGGGYMPIFQYWHRHCPSCIEILYFRTLC